MAQDAKPWFYGIRGITVIWHGSWADLELIWHNQSINYYDVETELYAIYTEECRERGIKPDDGHFAAWVKKHAGLCRDILQRLVCNRCFYGKAV